MKNNITNKLLIIFIFFLFIPIFGINQVFACTPGGQGSHWNGVQTGQSCTTPGQYAEPTCIGTCGYSYIVTYCSTFLCYETYPENGGNAPAACNKPCPAQQSDIGKVFGQIIPPTAIQNFGFGSAGISKFLSNLVILIYSLAAVVLILMILWGAFEWIISEGDKEKVAGAQKRIINAIIGIILFAVAFAIITVLGQFTGFKFFIGQQ